MERINTLFEKYRKNQCSPQEIEELLKHFKVGDDEVRLKEYIELALQHDSERYAELDDETDEVYSQIKAYILNNRSNTRKLFQLKWMAAASVILILAFGAYFLVSKPVTSNAVVFKKPNDNRNDIGPGSNKAILTLSNGQKIVLDGTENGVLANQGGINVVKKSNGELSYDAQSAYVPSDSQIAYNTITIPRGGQYHVTLPDGSSVLLNAASSLTYPIVFTGKSRNVELKGEAYFEVAKNKEKPFIIAVNDLKVSVLGTHFNISAYSDDPSVTTTLLEGSVRLNKGPATALLNPGQQGTVLNNGARISVENADVEEVIAWKNGLFVFNDESIKDVMKKAARWYDVEVEYKGNVQFKKFGGTTSRYINISELLDNMSITGGIHYKIDGRRVILMN